MKGSCRTDFTTSIFRALRSPLFSALPKHQVIFIFMRHRPHHLNPLSVHDISSGTFSQLQPLDAVFLHFFWLVAFVLSSCGLQLYLGLQSGSCDTSWDCLRGCNLHNTNWVHFLHFGAALGSWGAWPGFVQCSTGFIQQLVRTNLCG